jgi:outer membrane protein TolC
MKPHPSSRFKNQVVLVTLFLGFGLASHTGSAQNLKEPLALERAVALALETNQLMKAADLEVQAAETRTRSAFSGYLPKLNFDYNLTRGDNPVYVFGTLLTQGRFTAANFALSSLNHPAPLTNFQNRFSLTQPLFDFGRTRKAVAQSRLGRDLSEIELEKTRQDLIFRVFKSYFEALFAQEMVRVRENAERNAAADSEKADSLFKAGLAVESDLLSAKVHQAAQSEEVVKARNELNLAYSNLNFEMGLPLNQTYELVQPQRPYLAENSDLASLQAVALEKRPDFKQAQFASRSNELAAQSVKAGFWPTVSALGSWETDSQNFASNGSNNWMAGLNVHFNLFDGRADQARLAESRFQQRRSSVLQEHMAQAVRLQVQKAYLDLQTAGQRIDVNQQAVRQAEESLRIIRNRYEAGLTTITDLLRAETAVIQMKTNFLRASFDQRVSAANLELQTGRLSAASPILRD